MTLAFICLTKVYLLWRNSIDTKNKLCYLVVPNSEKENAPEGPTQKGLREAREKTKCKTRIKDNKKV